MNTAALKSGLDAANKKLEAFDGRMKAMLGLKSLQEAAQAAAAAVQAVTAFVMRGVDALDAMGKQAQFAGESVESFSQTAYAMRIAGVSSEELSKSMLALGKNMTAAASGSKEQLALFSALGVRAVGTNGQLRSTSDVLDDLADVFQKMPASAAKTQLAIELFGKGGERMGDALSRGSEGLKALRSEAKLLGLTVSGEAAAAANNFNEKLDRLQVIGESAAQVLAARLVPVFDSFIDRLMQSEATAKLLRLSLTLLEAALRGIALIAEGLVTAFDTMVSSIATARGAVSKLATIAATTFGGPIIGAFLGGKQAAEDFTKAVKKAKEATKGPSKQSAAEDVAAKAGTVTAEARLRRQQAILEAQRKAEEAAAKAKEARAQAIRELEKAAAGLEAQVRTFDATPFEQVVDSLERGELAEKLKLAGDKAGEFKKKILEAAGALQSLNDGKLSAQRAFELKMTVAAGNRSIDQQERGARDAGLTDEQRVTAALRSSGFGTSADAVAAQRAAMQRAAEASAAAAEAAARHNDDAARKYQEVATSAQAAEAAAAATAQAFLDAQLIAKAKMQAMRDLVISSATNKLGDLGNTINAGIQGAQAGGVWGAIIAVVLELLTKFARFQEIIGALNGGLTRILGVLGELVNSALSPALHGINYAIDAIVRLITPIANIIGSAFSTIMPLVETLMSLGEALGPVEWAIKGLTPVFNVIGLTVLGVSRALYAVWDDIINAVRDVMAFFGADVTGINADIAKHRAATAQLDARIARLTSNLLDPEANSPGPRISMHFHDLKDATKGATDSINAFAKALTNVPEGFRYAAAAYNAMDSVGGSGDGPGGKVFGQHVGQTINITVQGSIMTEQEIGELFDRHARRKEWRRGGSGARPGDYTR